MSPVSSPRTVITLFILLLLTTMPAHGQFVQTFVSVTGSNANDCATATTPCRTLAAALDRVLAGGKIFVLDSGDFQSAVIDRSVTIQAVGVDATIFTGTTTKIVIQAGPDGLVVLDGLNLRRALPASGDSDGIRVESARAVHVRNCIITGFGHAGILVNSSGPTQVHVSDTLISHGLHGIVARPLAGGGNIDVILDNVTLLHNADKGVHADQASIWLGGSTISFNGTGVLAENGGTIFTFGNNIIRANTVDGATTHKAGLQ